MYSIGSRRTGDETLGHGADDKPRALDGEAAAARSIMMPKAQRPETTTDDNHLASALLAHYGYSVDPIEETTEQRADLRAACSGEELIVEVKSRNDHAFWKAVHDAGSCEIDAPIGPDEAEVTTLREAKRQLRATPSTPSAVRAVCRILPTEADHDVLLANIYGQAWLWDLDAEGSLRRCYYYDSARFFRDRELDLVLAVVRQHTDHAEVHLHPNFFSPRLDTVLASRLYDRLRVFSSNPQQEENEGRALVADCWHVSLKDEAARLNYLRDKYKRPKLIRFRMRDVRHGVSVEDRAVTRS